jgi:anti-sigma regulatory factor (Ser/Thr protein kinase)
VDSPTTTETREAAVSLVGRAADRPEVDVECVIDMSSLGRVRRAVADYAAERDLPEGIAQDLVLAVNELATNVVRHGGGHGLMRLWQVGGTVHCEVSDHGPGLPAGVATETPGPEEVNGRGLWMVRLMSTTTSIDARPDGTTVTITASKDDRPER